MLFKNVHALWIMLGTTTRGDAHFCYTFWIFESMHKYLIWSCLNYINILMAPKMLGIGEGLWNIISRCHKYFQHLWKCFNISFRYKKMSEIEKENRKRKRLTWPYLAAQLAWHCWPSPPGARLSSTLCPLAASARTRPRHLLLRRVALSVNPIPRLETPRSPSLLSLTRCSLSPPLFLSPQHTRARSSPPLAVTAATVHHSPR